MKFESPLVDIVPPTDVWGRDQQCDVIVCYGRKTQLTNDSTALAGDFLAARFRACGCQ